jgi:hypothetical protein
MNNYLTEELRTAEPLGGHRLRLTFTDGYSAEIDLSPILDWGPIYEAIRNPEDFRQITVRYGVPEWPGDFDFSPGTLRAWCEIGKILTLDETAKWVRENTAPARQVA